MIKKQRRVLMIGQRTNTNLEIGNVVETEADIKSLASRGQLFTKLAEDYFIMSRGAFDWDKVISLEPVLHMCEHIFCSESYPTAACEGPGVCYWTESI